MAGQKFTLTFDANLNVSQMKSALGQIQSTLNGLHLPQNVTKGLQSTFDKLQKEIQAFEVAASKDITSKTDFKKLETQAAKVTDAFEKLKIQVRDLAKLNAKDLEKLFPQKTTQNIQDATNAVKQYQTNMANATKEVNKAQVAVNKLTAEVTKIQGKQVLTGDQYKQLTDNLKVAQQEVNDLDNKLKQLNTQEEQMRGSLSQPNKSSRYRQLVQDIKDVNDQLTTARQNAERLANQKANSTTFEKQAKDLADLNAKLAEATNKLNQYKQDLANIQSTGQGGGLKSLLDDIGRLTGMDMSKFSQDTKGAADAIQAYLNQELQKLNNNLHTVESTVNGASKPFEDLSHNVRDSGNALEQFNTQAREIDQLKSRIQYFFGLNNAIQLVKRTMREAYETIKDLDKAMTETAVVTDFSVGDMWAQLPDYTKRANELGVSTKAAYEAATLYYQQGLKTNEVMAMSNETLKMARIAGLDAAVATDRMTNAIRGFNMEINTTNAQRIDDVYSRLAAISASNVDEISTAMTKVASLAHGANMEFETTAAFLAQIIETTRESAETAGTALKTVVARFSEVKKLVSEGELKGSDEEGELIDVNKVSSALRTAGIDLNRYFLGEVGLDDIFLELASKWNSLTNLQQRYIATQAAGSRQQSRFIALMSDYARTQELVGEAYNANGAAAKQFEKTQESLESKLARLKNAWNEFAMGVLNSDIVKAGVDLLTNLLNGINALTSGFGTLNSGAGKFLNTFAKLALLIGGLNLGKGLTSGLLGSVGSILTGKAAAGTFQQMAATAMLGNSAGAVAGKGMLATMGMGFINPFVGLGKGIGGAATKAWGGMQTLGNIWGGISAGSTAAGIAGIATALGAVSVAALGVVAAYKAWEKWTPEGQLKVATKLAKETEENAEKARDVVKSYQEVQEAYKQYDDAVKNATSTTEKDTAIKSKNDYILSLIDRDATYAQYLQSATSESGQIVLTLNEEALAKAADEAAKAAVQANVDSYFAKAGQQDAQANANESKANRLETRISNLEADYRGNTTQAQELRAEKVQQELQAEAARAAASNYARLGYQELFSDSQLSNDIANALAGALGAIYNQTGRLSDNSLTQLQAWATGSGTQSIMSVIAGNVGNKNLLGLSDDEMLQALGINETSDAFKQFTELTGIGSKELKKFILGIAQSNKETQESNRQKLQEKFNNYGVTDNQQKVFFEMSTPDIQEAVSNTLDQIEGVITSGDYKNLIDILLDPETTEEDIRVIQSFINSINLDDPISAFTRLQDGINSTDENVKKLAQDILKSNQDVVGSGNLVKVALESAYDDVQKQIDKIIKKNGHITPDNVEELAEAAEDLAIIIDEGVASVEALAKAINLIEDGRITFEDLNDTVLDLLENMYTFDDLVQDVHDFIANFDEGIDYGEGIDFLVDKIFELEELTDNFEFGNERTQKLWKAFFGGNYEEDWARGEDWMRGRIQQMKAWLDNDAYGFFSDKNVMDQLGINLAGDHELDWDISHYKDLNDLLDDLTNKFKISSEAAKMFVEAFASHGDQDFYNQLQELSQKSAIGTMADQIGAGKHLWSQDEIDQIAKIAGMDADQLKDAINAELKDRYSGDNGIDLSSFFKVVDGPITGEDFFQQFKEKLELEGKDFDTWISQFIDGKKLKIEELRHALSDMGMDATAQADLIKSISESKQLEGAEVDLNNLKFTISSALGVEVDDQVVTDIVNKLQEATDSKEKKVTITDVETTLDNNGYSTDKAKEILEAIKSYFPDEVQIPLKVLPEIIEVESPLNGDLQMQLIEQGQNTGVGVYQSTVEVTPSVPEEAKLASGDLVKVSVIPVEPEIKEESAEQLTNKVESSITEGAEEGKSQLFSTAEEAAEYLYNQIKDGEVTAGQEGAAVIETSVENHLNASIVGQILYNKLAEAGNQAAYDLSNSLSTILGSTPFTINVQANVTGLPNGASGGVVGSGSAANGGAVSSYGSGGNHLTPGPALTGEEAPEIVWNKERGYAYITGTNGPEFRNLNPGDRVFNAAETRKILRNSVANGGVVASYARGRWNAANDGNVLNRGRSGGSSRSSGSGSGDTEKTPTVWENDLDWLYNLMEDISELERTQTKLAEKHDRYLHDISKTGRDLYNVTQDQLNNLYTQRDNEIEALTRRRQEMAEQIGISGYSNYVWWNDRDQTIEIDWDAIEAIQDKDTYDEVTDLISKVEKIQDQMDTARDTLWDIEGQIKELEDRYLQEFTEFQQRILDAVVRSYQDTIDNLTSLNDTLNDTNTSILESLQKEIEYSRQIRDNTDTENNIADMEARLAYLRRDTTGANEGEVRELERQLNETRQDYTDALIDQQLERLSEANDLAAEQRQQQIALMTEQLEYWQESGALWGEVTQLLADGISEDGSLIHGTELEQILQNAEGWRAMSEQQREVWGNDLITAANQAGAYLLKIAEGFDSLSAGVWAMLPSSSVTSQKLQYATGGMNTKTGWAWLDGTANDPEYVLNARQTDAFLKLADILPSMLGSGNTTTNNLGGNVYVELTMNVGEISNDYDVDRMVDRVKSNIYDASNYRNVNSVNFSR